MHLFFCMVMKYSEQNRCTVTNRRGLYQIVCVIIFNHAIIDKLPIVQGSYLNLKS